MASMDDHDGQVTRLGPDSGGRGTGEPTVRVYSWEWGSGAGRQPGLPWIGIFLLVFGGLLLIQQLFPEARALGSLLFVAIGLAFLVKWAIDRGSGSLYAGAPRHHWRSRETRCGARGNARRCSRPTGCDRRRPRANTRRSRRG